MECRCRGRQEGPDALVQADESVEDHRGVSGPPALQVIGFREALFKFDGILAKCESLITLPSLSLFAAPATPRAKARVEQPQRARTLAHRSPSPHAIISRYVFSVSVM